MNDDDKQAAVTAMHDAILDVHNMMQMDAESDIFSETRTMAHAAVAALQSAGFRVARHA